MLKKLTFYGSISNYNQHNQFNLNPPRNVFFYMGYFTFIKTLV